MSRTSRMRNFVPVGQRDRRGRNRDLGGWGGYFRHGYPHASLRKLNGYVIERLRRHLKRRSQRPDRAPGDRSFYAHLVHDLGLRCRGRGTSGLPVHVSDRKDSGKPDAGKSARPV